MVRTADGTLIEAASWIPSQTRGQIHVFRTKSRSQLAAPLFTCFGCGVPAILRQAPDRGHHFIHHPSHKKASAGCVYKDDRGISTEERDRIRYHGQREGRRHIETKRRIKAILDADPRFKGSAVEQTWTTFSDGWRKPDVQSKWNDLSVVFEAQVSNTYPHVVAERTDFYRKQGALLIWIFDRVPEGDWRAMHADAFCSNEQHLLIADDSAVEHSQATGIAHFRVLSMRPDVAATRRESDRRVILNPSYVECNELVPFDRLQLNAIAQTAATFVVDDERQRALHKVLCAEAQASGDSRTLEVDLRERLGVAEPIPRERVEHWATLICAIESCRHRLPVGTGLVDTNYAGVANLVVANAPELLQLLVETIDRLAIHPPATAKAWTDAVRDYRSGRYKAQELPPQRTKARAFLDWLYPKDLSA